MSEQGTVLLQRETPGVSIMFQPVNNFPHLPNIWTAATTAGMKVQLLFLITAALFVGCADTQVLRYDNTVRLPSSTVHVLGPGDQISSSALYLAEMSWKGPRQDELKAKQYFITQTQKLGGNAMAFEIAAADPHTSWSIAGANGTLGGGGKTEIQWLFKARAYVLP